MLCLSGPSFKEDSLSVGDAFRSGKSYLEFSIFSVYTTIQTKSNFGQIVIKNRRYKKDLENYILPKDKKTLLFLNVQASCQ